MSAEAAIARIEPAFDPFESLLERFTDASPHLLECRELLRRVDSKFSLTACRLDAFIPTLAADYAVLRVPLGGAIATYRSLYFDTSDLRCFHDHRRGRRIRHKVRIRHYPDRRVSFLEIKSRCSEQVIDKQRIPIAYGQDRLGANERAFLRRHIDGLADQLRPQMWIDHRRISLIGVHTHERVTIDLDLEIKDLDGGRRRLPPIAVIEVKQAPFSVHTPVMRALFATGLRAGSHSKYITAVAFMRPEVRHDRLLPDLRAIERIEP